MLKFEFTQQMTQIIGEALGNAPYRIAAPVIAELQRQIDAQTKPQPQAQQTNGGAYEINTGDIGSAVPDRMP